MSRHWRSLLQGAAGYNYEQSTLNSFLADRNGVLMVMLRYQPGFGTISFTAGVYENGYPGRLLVSTIPIRPLPAELDGRYDALQIPVQPALWFFPSALPAGEYPKSVLERQS